MGDVELDLDRCYEVAVQVAKEAGQMIREAFSVEKRVQFKTTETDLVTETDQNVEKLIIAAFNKHFPTHSFIGEESVAAGDKCNLTENPTWIVDPIDGTTNFVHCFPFVCVSIALWVNKKAEVAVIYNPILQEMFTARPGKGAFCNDTKITVTTTKDLSKALMIGEFGGSHIPEKLDPRIRNTVNIVKACHGVRSLGSAALNMCYVAAGRVDGYVALCLHCWDMAAGELIVREAGGLVTSPDGGEFDLMSRNVLCAASPELASQLYPLVESPQFERD